MLNKKLTKRQTNQFLSIRS